MTTPVEPVRSAMEAAAEKKALDMTVLDVSDPPQPHELCEEARLRGCKCVSPRTVYLDRVSAQYRAITGKDLPEEATTVVPDATAG